MYPRVLKNIEFDYLNFISKDWILVEYLYIFKSILVKNDQKLNMCSSIFKV